MSIINDNPSGTLLAVLVTGNSSEGYGLLMAEWGIWDKYLVCNDSFSGTRYATVTWLYK